MFRKDRYDETTNMILDVLGDFLRKEVRPIAQKYEEKEIVPLKQVAMLGELGILGLTIPEAYGGMGMGTLASSLVARELAYEWPSLHLVWTANASLAATPIIIAGTEKQKKNFLPKLSSGEMLGCYALTEPDAGSDAGSLTTKAKFNKSRNVWVLNGVKTFITNAVEATIAIVFARTGEDPRDISAFIVEGEGPGIKKDGVAVSHIPKRGLRSSSFSEIEFNNVEIPKDSLLGKKNKGFSIALETLDSGRINISAQAVGIATRIFDDALSYVKDRKTFGSPVWENQKVQMDFAGWASELSAAWALVEQVSRKQDAGTTSRADSAYAKLFATKTAKRVASEASEYFGGLGYTSEAHVLSFVLDSFATVIYEGASNIQMMVIARELSD